MTDENVKTVSLREFFEKIPPQKFVRLDDAPIKDTGAYGTSYEFEVPIIQLRCSSEHCDGDRWFDPKNKFFVKKEELSNHFIHFVCRNCGHSKKYYAIAAQLGSDGKTCEVGKYGELWPFGPHTPSKVISLIGPDRDYFLKGRRCENQGLGIGAFGYYRRVVENQKGGLVKKWVNRIRRRPLC